MVLLSVLYVSVQKFWLIPQCIIITLSPATLEPVYNVNLFCYSLSIFWEHQQIFQRFYFVQWTYMQIAYIKCGLWMYSTYILMYILNIFSVYIGCIYTEINRCTDWTSAYTESMLHVLNIYTDIKCWCIFCEFEWLLNHAEAKLCGKTISSYTDCLTTSLSTHMLNVFNLYNLNIFNVSVKHMWHIWIQGISAMSGN